MRRQKRDPKTPAEWQEAVDGAAACRAIADCQMYGLLQGGPKIDVVRCDEILERGAARGIRPSREPTDLAVGYVQAYNADLAAGRCQFCRGAGRKPDGEYCGCQLGRDLYRVERTRGQHTVNGEPIA